MSSLLCECVSYIHSLNNTSSPTSCGYVLCVTIKPFLVNIFLNFSTHLSALLHLHSNPDALDSWNTKLR